MSVALAQSPRLRQQRESNQSPLHMLSSVGEEEEEEAAASTSRVSIETSINSRITLKSCAKYRLTTDELKAFLSNGDPSMCIR